MSKRFNKYFVKRLMGSSVLVASLFFSNTLLVSAEAPLDSAPSSESVQKEAVDSATTDLEFSKNDSDEHSETSFNTYEIFDNAEETPQLTEESEEDDQAATPGQESKDSEVSKEEEAASVEEFSENEAIPATEEPTDTEELAETEELSDTEKTEESEEPAAEFEDMIEPDETDETETLESEEADATDHPAETDDTLESLNSQAASADVRAAQVTAAGDGHVERIDGANRVEVAVNISKEGWTSSDIVFVANGRQAADALTGAPLASYHDAPILYVNGSALPNATLNEIKRLGAKKVVILGGTTSVPTHIENTLKNNKLAVERIAGKTRYDVAAGVAEEIMEVEGTNRDAYLVNGNAYADALSVAPIAASKRLPIFLTGANSLHTTVKKAIPKVHSWIIIGGEQSIPTSLINEMKALGAKIHMRFDGNNRYAVNRNVITHYGNSRDYLYVASGEVFSDALTASALAGKEQANILLVKNNNVDNLDEQTEFAKDDKRINEFIFVGGIKTLSSVTENHFVEPVVYLDPGHGGAEPGTAHYGIVEKNLNLSISRKISERLKNYGYDVVASRTNDKYVDLYARAHDANASDADIFVSVHNNAMPGNSNVSGIETYYYQYHATDTYKPQYDRNSPEYAKATSQQRAADSLRLANAIHRNVVSSTGAPDRGVREMGFAVIRETTMPAVLLELGYVSNYNEAHKLNTNSYQNTLADSVVKGINSYFGVV